MLLSNQSYHSSLACSAALLEGAGYTCPVFDSFLDVGIVAFHSTCRQPVPHAVSFAPETHYRTCCTASIQLSVYVYVCSRSTQGSVCQRVHHHNHVCVQTTADLLLLDGCSPVHCYRKQETEVQF